MQHLSLKDLRRAGSITGVRVLLGDGQRSRLPQGVHQLPLPAVRVPPGAHLEDAADGVAQGRVGAPPVHLRARRAGAHHGAQGVLCRPPRPPGGPPPLSISPLVVCWDHVGAGTMATTTRVPART